ncbi:MAG: ATP-binding protein, partial [Candidatus Gribaldobacteria bacterium]|nr:ATP-binding protein [Candidatus Gribaldobacteria bacterium]
MFSKVYSAVTKGLSGQLVEIETMANKGLRSFNIVGLADQAIDEAKERVNAAIKSIGLNPPHSQTQKVIVNLAPADLKKEGTLYDLPIALGFLLATEQVKFSTQKILFAGELSLDGRLKAIPGTLTLTFLAKNQGFTKVILPQSNTAEASLINLLNEKNNPQIIGANNLKEVIDYLEERLIIEPAVFQNNLPEDNYTNFEIDFSSIGGQTHSKRGLEIAASGNHNLLLEGPPGTGKTLLAKAIISILPKPEPEEIIEITKIYSLAGLLDPSKPVFNQRPFRSPHHTASESALLGGGPNAKPGEITLAHRGVLFLDEFP